MGQVERTARYQTSVVTFYVGSHGDALGRFPEFSWKSQTYPHESEQWPENSVLTALSPGRTFLNDCIAAVYEEPIIGSAANCPRKGIVPAGYRHSLSQVKGHCDPVRRGHRFADIELIDTRHHLEWAAHPPLCLQILGGCKQREWKYQHQEQT
jgi:hypothetical protein